MAFICIRYKYLSVFLVVLSLASWVQAQTTCSASQPCAVGCCSKYGSCGFGADFCSAANCIGTCNAKSECDPGWGAQWSAHETCPLNVCCSQYGFCGTSKDFCGDTRVTKPVCTSSTATNGRKIGYYEGWAATRSCDAMQPEDIPAGDYTHLNFAFAYINPSTFQIAPMDSTQTPLYSRVTALKNSHPGLQVWISIGGWTFNDPGATATTFSQLAASSSAQSTFFSSLLSFMSTYGFDGVDIDWEYPGATDRSGNSNDFVNFVTFLSNLKSALGSHGLSITIPTSYWYLQHFDIVNIEPHIDWFNIMTYDLHGTWDGNNPYTSAIVQAHTNLTDIDTALDLLWRNDINPAKVNLGLAFYGRSFTLANTACNVAGCAFSSTPATAGACTGQSGILSALEINRQISSGATVRLDPIAAVKIVTWGNQWVSYDDEQTLQMKYTYANANCLGGTLVWAVSLDSTSGTYSDVLHNAGVGGAQNCNTSPGQAAPGSTTSGVVSPCYSWYTVQSGDICDSIIQKYGITFADLQTWNPALASDCSNLLLGYSYCVSGSSRTACSGQGSGTATNVISASLYSWDPAWAITDWVDAPPQTFLTATITGGVATPTPHQPNMVSGCTQFYQAVSGDYCYLIASNHGISTSDFMAWNPDVGSDCSAVWVGDYYCVSKS